MLLDADPHSLLSKKESLKNARNESIEVIQQRPPEKLHENLERNISWLTNYFLEKKNKGYKKFLRKVFEAKTKRNFLEKVVNFQKYFDTEVFNSVCHWTAKEIPEGLLKSPQTLTDEARISLENATQQSGELDEKIGNTRYVFANSEALISRSASGLFKYKIESQRGYVVPFDIADLKSPDVHIETDPEARENWRIKTYSENLYTFADFKTFFAVYCAVFFDDPREAVDFFARNRAWIVFSDCWDDAYIMSRGNSSDNQLKIEMKNVLVTSGILPPVSPEFQFKDQVGSKKINQNT